MKYIAFILSLLIFSMSVSPCSDWYTCDDNQTTELSPQHDHSQDTTDHCTPFCICSCCGVSFTIAKLKITPKDFSTPIFSPNFYYNSNHSFDYFGNVWQPPKYC